MLERSAQVDAIVTGAASTLLAPKLGNSLALTAVGGYGRRELFPHSDIDILLLFEDEAELTGAKEPLSDFLRSLWDTGLRVSHSVRTIAECCRLQEQNLELHISLLDVRYLSGSAELFARFTQKLPGFYQRYAKEIRERLAVLARQRHAKFNNTVYHLEPNVKEAPGGIRDIHLLRWLSQLAPQYPAFHEFFDEVRDAQHFLYTARAFLHVQAGRDSNLLTFELQYEAGKTLAGEPLAPAEWMRLYFRHSRRVLHSTLRALEYVDAQDTSLLRHFRDWRSRLSTREYTVNRERIFLRNPVETLQSAESVLRLFTFAARHGIQLSWDTQRRIRESLPDLGAGFAKRPPPSRAWTELFSQPHTAFALHDMQETGLLTAALPEWNAIDSLVVPDFYHRYTVDEHTILAIEAIDQLLTARGAPSSRFHDLLLEEEHLAVLRLALLLHDLGKGARSGDHVQGSLQAADAILDRLSFPETSRDKILFLIEHHLDLSVVMNGRDLDDPATARFLSSRVETEERLRSLTLLTYADISAVNPTAMSPWRLEQLWRVYAMGSEELSRELLTNRVHAAGGSTNSREMACFLEGFPARYLRTHTPVEIDHHLELYAQAGREGVAVEIDHRGGAYLMTVLGRDRAGLFASLCGALASFGMNIVKAEASSNAAGCILDLIRFTDPNRTLELNPSEIERLEQTIKSILTGSADAADLLKRRRTAPRPSRHAAIHPAIRFDHQASDSCTLIDFVGEDRPGLLYDLASALSEAGCNIEVLLIDTQAHKALDVFYVSREGAKLDSATEERLRTDLVQAASH